MRSSRLAWLFALAFAACSNGNTSTNPPPTTTPTTGGIKGVATLGGMTSGDSGIIVGVLGGALAYTDDAGNWAIGDLPPGNVTVQASHPGYMPATTTATITAGSITMASPLDLTPIPTTPPMGGLSGHVFLFDTSAAAGSMVTLSPSAGVAMTAADGSWSMSNVPAGVYDITFAHASYVSQTVNNVVVGDKGNVTVADVTLRRNTTIVDGHSISQLGSSPDHSLQLMMIDNAIEVVSESNGAAVTVGAGTSANSGAIANDDKHLYLTDGNGMLWVGTTDGRSLSFLTATFNGSAWLSDDGSHLAFEAQDAQGATDLYLVSTSGGAPTLVVSNANQVNPAFGIFGVTFTGLNAFVSTGNDANGNPIADAYFVDMNSGVVTKMTSVILNNRVSQLLNTPSFELFFDSLGTQPSTSTSIGDLYLWKPGTPPIKLSGGTSSLPDGGVDVNAPLFVNFPVPSALVWTSVMNFDSDNTFQLDVIDVKAGAVRNLIAHTTAFGPFANGFPLALGAFPAPSYFPQKLLALDMHDNASVYTYDVVVIDYLAGTRTLVQANAARLSDGPAAANDFVFDYARPAALGAFDFLHFLIGNSRSSPNSQSTMNWDLYDGTLHHLNPPASPISTDTNFNCSSDFRVCYYATPYGPPTATATPLTIVNLPPFGTAGDGVVVPLASNFYPPGGTFGPIAISTDHSTLAFVDGAGALYKVATAASATPVTPTQLLAADPNAGASFSWVALSGKGDLVFTGDTTNAANAWVVPAAGTATPLDAANFGTTRPGVFAIADGARTFVSDESGGGNFLVQVDTGATPTLTHIDNYVTGSSRMNGTSTRYFYQSSTGPALTWANSSTSGTVAGTWSLFNWPAPAPWAGIADPSVTYFKNGNLMTAFDGATSVVPLATNDETSIAYSYDPKTVLLVDRDASGVNHLIASPRSAPARIVVADGYPSTAVPTFSHATNARGFYSPDYSTLYAWGDANAGTGNPASWTLSAVVLASTTEGTLGTALHNNGGATFGTTGKYLVFATPVDPLLATFTAYTTTVGTTTATKVSDNVRTVSLSSTDNVGLLLLLSDGTSHVASATGGAAAVALDASSSTNTQLFWSADGSRLFAFDSGSGNGFGNVWAGKAGTAGALYDTDVVGNVMPDFTGQNLLTVALHPADGFVVLDHESIP